MEFHRTAVAGALVVVALGISGCSGGNVDASASLQPYEWSDAGPAIADTCTVADYQGDGSPTCSLTRDVWDFSQQDIVIEYYLVQYRAEPMLLADPVWLVDFAQWDGSTPVADYVASLNAAYEEWWTGPSASSSGLGWAEGLFNEEVLLNLDGTMMSMNPRRTIPDVIDTSKQGPRLEGTDLIVRGANRVLGLPPGAETDINLDPGMHVADGVVTLDFDAAGLFAGAFEIVVVLAGRPTETNGEVHGNTVVWRSDGTETSAVIHLVGPIANTRG